MAEVTREDVANALFDLVSVAVGAVVGLVTSSRKFKAPEDVSATQMPALYLLQGPEKYERQERLIGIPPTRTMRFEIALYVSDAQEDSVVPATQLNAMINAIEVAMFAGVSATTGICTLGDLVRSARIEGEVKYFENLTGDGKSIAAIPIEVIRP